MRGNSQLLRSTNSFGDKTGSMKTPVMLLLTNDTELEELVADALSEIGAYQPSHTRCRRRFGNHLRSERSRSCHNRFRTRPSWDDVAQCDQRVARGYACNRNHS